MRSFAVRISLSKRCPGESAWAKSFALLNPFLLGWQSQFTFSSEPCALMITLISLYRRLNKQPTDFCFNGNLSITFSRKFPSERNYVLRLPHAFMSWKQSKKTGQLCPMFSRLSISWDPPWGEIYSESHTWFLTSASCML